MRIGKIFSLFLIQTYVVGTQKKNVNDISILLRGFELLIVLFSNAIQLKLRLIEKHGFQLKAVQKDEQNIQF